LRFERFENEVPGGREGDGRFGNLVVWCGFGWVVDLLESRMVVCMVDLDKDMYKL